MKYAKQILAVWIYLAASGAASAEAFHGAGHGVFFDAAAPGMPMPPPAPGAAPFMHGSPFSLVMLAEKLELDDEQRRKAGRIMDETLPKMRELMFRMSDSRKAAAALLESGPVGDAELRRLAEEHGRIVSEMLYLDVKSRSDFQALLTGEQRRVLEGMHGLRGSRSRGGFTERLPAGAPPGN